MKFSPSRAHRWVGGGCTASCTLEPKAYKRPSGPAADEGKRLHALAAEAVTGLVAIPDVDRETIAPYVDDVLAAQERYGGLLRVEHAVTHRDFGRCVPDASLSAAGRLIVWDLKTGRRPVEVVENYQLLIYAGLIARIGQTVELRIVQPTVYHPDGYVRSWEPGDMVPWQLKIRLAIKQARDCPRMVATPANCTYCAAVTSCAAARDVTLGGADMAMKDTGRLPGHALRSELVTLRTASKVMQIRLDALEVETKARMRSGERVPGCRFATGQRGKLDWAAEPDEIQSMVSVMGVDAFAEPSLRTPTQVIKAGVPEEIIAKLAKRRPSATVVATDAAEHRAKVFSK